MMGNLVENVQLGINLPTVGIAAKNVILVRRQLEEAQSALRVHWDSTNPPRTTVQNVHLVKLH